MRAWLRQRRLPKKKWRSEDQFRISATWGDGLREKQSQPNCLGMTSCDSSSPKVRFPHFRRRHMWKPNVLIKRIWVLLVIEVLIVFLNLAYAQQEQRAQTSYMKVHSTEPFAPMIARMTAAQPQIPKEHNALRHQRHDL